MIIGMVLIKKMSAGADIFDQLAGQGFVVDLDASDKAAPPMPMFSLPKN